MWKAKTETTKTAKNILIVLLIICVNIFFLMFTKQFKSLESDFNAYTWGAKLSGIAEALKYKELRLWNPNIWCGVSGIHNFTDSFYPFAILICKLFWNAEKEILSFTAYSFFALIHDTIATTGFYFLLKELGMDDIVCVLTVLIGTPLAIVNIPYLQICWIPLFGYIFLKAYKEAKFLNIFSIVAGITFGLFLLQELSQGAVMGVLLMGIFYFTSIYVIVNKEKQLKSIRKITLLFIIVGIIGICVSAVNLFPILEQQSELLRMTVEGFSSAAEGVPLGNFYAHPINLDTLREILGAKSGESWFGILAVLFCVMGMFTKENYSVNPYSYITLQFGKVLYCFIVLSSISCYFPEIFYHIPFVNMLRETYLYAYLLPFASTILAAYGIYTLYCQLTDRKSRISFYNIPLMGVLCALIILQYPLANYNNSSIWLFLLLIMGIIFMFAFRKNKYILQIVLLLIGIVNIVHVNKYYNATNTWTMLEAKNQYEHVLNGYQGLKNYMDSMAKGVTPYRVMTWAGEKGSFSANSMVDIGGQYTEGYWEPIYIKTLDRHWNLDLEKRVMLNNVLYFVISQNESNEWTSYISSVLLDRNFELIGTIDDIYPNYDAKEGQSLCVYRNKNYIGDAWMVYDYMTCDPGTSPEEQFAIINDPSFSVRDTALVEVADEETKELLAEVCLADENAGVELVNYTNNSIELNCKTETAGILVMAESDAKGWKAYVDGQKQEILTIDYGNRGLLIEPGAHNIKMVYCPNGYIFGGILTLVTIFICIIAILMLAIQRKKIWNK